MQGNKIKVKAFHGVVGIEFVKCSKFQQVNCLYQLMMYNTDKSISENLNSNNAFAFIFCKALECTFPEIQNSFSFFKFSSSQSILELKSTRLLAQKPYVFDRFKFSRIFPVVFGCTFLDRQHASFLISIKIIWLFWSQTSSFSFERDFKVCKIGFLKSVS